MSNQMMDADLENCFKSLSEAAVSAYANYQVWFAICGSGKVIDSYRKEIFDPKYSDFIRVILSSLYKVMFIEVSCIFESGSDDRVNTMKKYKSLLRTNGYGEYADKIDSDLKRYRCLVSGMLTVRSKLVAHKEGGISQAELFENHDADSTNKCIA